MNAALEDLHKLKAVSEKDYKGLVELVHEVESAYSQLDELGNLNILMLRDVDMIIELLPCHLKVDWRSKYRETTSIEKVHPFVYFMQFLKREREAVARIAEVVQSKRKSRLQTFHGNRSEPKKYYKCAYPTHQKDTINHTTEQCKELQKLSIGGNG